MENMPKPPYLASDDKGLKLRRTVPSDVKKIIGKATWVRRLSGLSAAEVRQQANLFAVETDAEIVAARSSKIGPSESRQLLHGADEASGFIIPLSDDAVRYLARSYFLEHYQAESERPDYVVAKNTKAYQEVLVDAEMDLVEAKDLLTGNTTNWGGHSDQPLAAIHPLALSLLIKQGYLSKRHLEGELSPRGRPTLAVPDWLLVDRHFEQLCVLLSRAQIELANLRLRALKAGKHGSIEDHLFRGLIDQPLDATKHVTVSTLIEAFKAKKQGLTAARTSQFQIAFRALTEELGENFLIAEIEPDDCQSIADLFVDVPAYATQHYKGMSLQQAADAYRRKNGVSASRHDEAAKNLAVLKSIFAVGVQRRWLKNNPAEYVEISGQPKKKAFEYENGYEPFDLDDLLKIFSAPLFIGCVDDEYGSEKPGQWIVRRHRYWAPILALFTGMRMNEILQLERGDLKQEQGVWFLKVTDEAEIEYDKVTFEKRLKNKNALRDIPLHPELIKLGFVAWASTFPPGRLFPEALSKQAEKPSVLFSKRFNTFLKKRGVWVHRRKVFHSFRGTFNDALGDGGVSREMRENINGWERQRSMDSRYGRGRKIEMLYDEICKWRLDGLSLSHLHLDETEAATKIQVR